MSRKHSNNRTETGVESFTENHTNDVKKEENTMDEKKKELKRKKSGKTGFHKPVPWSRKRAFILCLTMAVMITTFTVPVFATDDPIQVVNNLSDFVYGLIQAVGIILVGWGIVQVGLSFQSHDPTQRSNGFLTLAGGVVIMFAHEIVNLITT